MKECPRLSAPDDNKLSRPVETVALEPVSCRYSSNILSIECDSIPFWIRAHGP